MRWKGHLRRLLVATGMLTILLGAGVAHADQSITITPTNINKTIQPGQAITGTIEVLNQADSPFDFITYPTAYSVTGEDYDPSFTPIPGATDVTKWVTLKAAKTHLDPFSVALVTYTINVPTDAKAGGYYVVIFAETGSQASGSGVVTKKRVGAVLYISVAGDVKQSGSVASWSVPWFQQAHLTQTVRVRNDGGVHFPAVVRTQVKDLLGNTKLSYMQQRNILPEKIRRIIIPWDKTPAFGLFKVDGTVEILGKTSKLSTKYVLVMNKDVQHLLLSALILLLFGLAVRFIWKKRQHKKAAKRAKDDAPSSDSH